MSHIGDTERRGLSRRRLILGAALGCGDLLAAPVARPSLQVRHTILSDPAAQLRDPSAVHEWDGVYHCWPTRIEAEKGTIDGWWGTIWHYSARNLDGPWQDRGPAIPHEENPEAYGSLGTYTCDVIRDPGDGKWYLFYSSTKKDFTTERSLKGFKDAALGMATASGPDGPWRKSPQNPIVQVGSRKEDWDGLRVDEGTPIIFRGQRRLYMKGVGLHRREPFDLAQSCGLYHPAGEAPWGPPYQPHGGNPVVRGPQAETRFEAYSFFPGPDKLLHMTTIHQPVRGMVNHLVSSDGLRWRFIEKFFIEGIGNDDPYIHAPHPVWKGTPGDEGEVIAFVDQFRDKDKMLKARLLDLKWE